MYKRPCVGCPPDIHGHAHPIKPMWYGMYNRIFPDEVPNLNKYLNSNFKKNYRDKKGMKNKQNLAPLEVKSTSVNLFFYQNYEVLKDYKLKSILKYLK